MNLNIKYVLETRYSKSSIEVLDSFESRMNYIWTIFIDRQQCVLKSPKPISIRGYSGDVWASTALSELKELTRIPKVLDMWNYKNRNFIIMEHIEGKIPRPTQKMLGYRIGKILFMLHSINIINTSYGLPYDSENQFVNWNTFIRKKISTLSCDFLMQYGFSTERILELCLSDYQAKPHVVHGDFHIENILASKTTINGLIDWDSVLFGDPMYDLGTSWAIDEEIWVKEIIRGYISAGGVIDHQNIRKYGFLKLFDIVAMLAKSTLKIEAKKVLSKLINKLHENTSLLM